MAVNKNFVVKNGIEVNDNLIIGISTNKTVGIGSTQPEYNLDVRGGIGVTDLIVSGGSTTQNLAVSAAATTKDLLVTGVSTFTGIGTFGSDVYVDGNLTVVGDLSLDEITGRNIYISGLSTFAGISTFGDDVYITVYSTITQDLFQLFYKSLDQLLLTKHLNKCLVYKKFYLE